MTLAKAPQIMKRILASVLLAVSLSTFAGTLPPALVQTIKAYEQAQTHNDVGTLSALVSDDFILVNSNASVEDKRQFLADFNLPGFKIDPYAIEERIDRAWSGGAITGGLLNLRWTQDGRHQSRKLRIVYVWEERGGRWQAVYAQVTRVP
ncbi:nuclear transport factor 2 family protein [Rhodanobacter sp. C03]|uniref:nuclear transport factor 2 family protein n=1 Tax=Rhodanobacter sp. C03 TaxID=1945858 RepID=UPI0009849E09|nr:nuclear transport factor 2 family protein [Rhodanobacter sp. C03]OOG60174.1 hypothetical protein B0E48_05325 [Rhodanobacter sp. C03]